MDSRDLFDLGLQADLAMVRQSAITRRDVLKLGLVGISALLAGCTPAIVTSTSAPPTTAAPADSTSPTTASTTDCPAPIPGETAGPYPADGSNASSQSLNALALSGIVRQDIRTSLSTGNVAEGIPFTIELTLVNTNNNCAPLADHALYLWHCNRAGEYSLYSANVTAEDYLRGVQASDAEGKVTFTSIFPACYRGRWPHVHFEVYPSLEQATAANNVIHTSQMALPEDICKTVYATDGYDNSTQNLSDLSLETDNVFRDGYSLQMATLTGDVTNGYTAKLIVGVAA